MTKDNDEKWLLEAIELSANCPTTDKAFSVGAIIIGSNNQVISTGYSREDNSGDHAEEVAITKALGSKQDLKGATIYSSLEPCNPRLSGKTSCTDLIIQFGIKRVVFALHEPPVFVTCTGTKKLKDHGVEVVVLNMLADFVKLKNKQFFSELKEKQPDNENGSHNLYHS